MNIKRSQLVTKGYLPKTMNTKPKHTQYAAQVKTDGKVKRYIAPKAVKNFDQAVSWAMRFRARNPETIHVTQQEIDSWGMADKISRKERI